jgi:hypothetical protein
MGAEVDTKPAERREGGSREGRRKGRREARWRGGKTNR